MAAIAEMQTDGFSDLHESTGSALVTYGAQSVNAIWATRVQGLGIEEGPKATMDDIRCVTLAASWSSAPTEGKVITNPATGDQWRVIRREFAGALLTFILETKSK